ncbi:response regulator transcription factor [Bacteroidota bacterium]
MNVIRVSIVHESYIIRKGFSSLLLEFPEIFALPGLDSIEMIEERLKKDDPHVLLIQSEIVLKNKSLISKLRNSFSTKLFIELVHQNVNPSNLFPIIYIDNSKQDLVTSINRLILDRYKSKYELIESSDLSDREKAVVREVALGYTNKEIADRLFISTHTVITHRKNITRKLGIKTVSGITVYAILNKLVEMSELKK